MDKLKEQFEKLKKLAFKSHNEGKVFDDMLIKKFGTNYSNLDLDSAIDTLDYGTGDMTFKEFINEMEEEIKSKGVGGK